MSNLLTISYGDTQAGAQALEAALQAMADVGAVFEIETVQLGAEMEKLGYEKGFDQEAVNKIKRAGILLKAPTEKNITPDLKQALGEDCSIFEPKDTTYKSAFDAVVDILRHTDQIELANQIINP